MPIEMGIWRIDGAVNHMRPADFDLEERLEEILDEDVSVAAPNWLVIGRQVTTRFGGIVDLLCMDPDGSLIVLELKRGQAPREILAQLLDYGSWVTGLQDEDIAQIYENYLERYHPERRGQSLDEAFRDRFDTSSLPDELNASHELVIVAASLDLGAERLVNYLVDYHGLNVNAVFFRLYIDEDRQYLARAWMKEPTLQETPVRRAEKRGEWNGEYYGSFGGRETRDWEEARRFGFFSAGGGGWYTNTLGILSPGDRLWVNIPGTGYVGVGTVAEEAMPIDGFMVSDDSGEQVHLIDLPVEAAALTRDADDPENAEYMVRMNWIHTVPETRAVKEKGSSVIKTAWLDPEIRSGTIRSSD